MQELRTRLAQRLSPEPEERFAQEAGPEAIPDQPPSFPDVVPPSYPSARPTPPMESESFILVTGTTVAAQLNGFLTTSGGGSSSIAAGSRMVLDQQLGFGANTVIVDNLSAQWVYLPDADRYVPPLSIGAVLPLNGSQRARALWQTPPGWIAPVLNAVHECRLIFTQDRLPPVPGVGSKNLATAADQATFWP